MPVSVATGLVGYPSYSQYGVLFQSVFNPDIRFRDTVYLQTGMPAQAITAGGTASTQVLSTQATGTQASTGQVSTTQAAGGTPPASGLWVVQNVRHDLQTERPDGPWFTTVEAARPDFAGQAFAK
ncbi:hypothetical protein GOB86_10835 [Acetobacter lambici]|uniref:Uncharacterized protein n=1 Tax=Acetobacter lambici TaxID=1332824 RepID=A0ABT1EY77_9PROT|nr:hypothetical protein [Acetobacter lambici]MCP1241776.1 hypothetical protein [Acetobacter lambici]MCP1257901.1 hypothetical protein [Acetobacter lambici]NHO57542.1 hypothetical protein [Acetobacter lambici]